MSHDPHAAGATRRGFLQSAEALAGTPLVAAPAHAVARHVAEQLSAAPVALTLRVNGRDHALRIEPRSTLLDALRDHLGLTGTNEGCDRSQCGACTCRTVACESARWCATATRPTTRWAAPATGC